MTPQQTVDHLRNQIHAKYAEALRALDIVGHYLSDGQTSIAQHVAPATSIATDPIGRRISPPSESPKERAERCLLVINQLGPMTNDELATHIGAKSFTTRYCVQRCAALCNPAEDSSKIAALRVSTLWTREDAEEFGEPQVFTGRRWGEKADDDSGPRLAAEETEDVIEDEPADEEEAAEGIAEESDDEPQPVEPKRENAEQLRPIVEKTEKWIHSAEKPQHPLCELCDVKFNNELICIATDFHGTKVMCKPCARRAGHHPPGSQSHRRGVLARS